MTYKAADEKVVFLNLRRYNSAEKIGDQTKKDVKVWVRSNGVAYWSVPGLVTFSCATSAFGETGTRPFDDGVARAAGGRLWPAPIDMKLFPFDAQRCELLYGGWNNHGLRMTFELMGDGIDGKLSNSAWKATVVGAEVKSFEYECCPEPWPHPFFYIMLEREYRDYVFNIFCPVLLAVYCGMIAYWLPLDQGERIGLGVTCLLTVLAVMFITNESLPATKDFTLLSFFYVYSLVFTLVPLFNSALVIGLDAKGKGVREDRAAWYKTLETLWHITAPGDGGGGGTKRGPARRPRNSSSMVADLFAGAGGAGAGATPVAHLPSFDELAAMIDRSGRTVVPASYAVCIAMMSAAAYNHDPGVMSNGNNVAFCVTCVLVFLASLVLQVRRHDNHAARRETMYARAGIRNSELTYEDIERYRDDFARFDVNMSGAVDVSEMLYTLRQSGRIVDADELDRRIEVLDRDGDKSVSFAEYVNLFETATAHADGSGRGGDSLEHAAKTWDPRRVAAWLTASGFGDVAPRFEEEEVTGPLLLNLTDEQLRDDLGVRVFGRRARLLAAVDALVKDEIKARLQLSTSLKVITEAAAAKDMFTHPIGYMASDDERVDGS